MSQQMTLEDFRRQLRQMRTMVEKMGGLQRCLGLIPGGALVQQEALDRFHGLQARTHCSITHLEIIHAADASLSSRDPRPACAHAFFYFRRPEEERSAGQAAVRTLAAVGVLILVMLAGLILLFAICIAVLSGAKF